ncbi:MAG: universal stress protein [Thermoleophilia bacterium]|nr:universal stress protein [Thermoleophilia bacterium]
MNTILVGVDGSEAAGVALEFAVEEAALRGASLRVVSIWEAPPLAQQEALTAPGLFDALQRGAEIIVAEAVERVKELNPDLLCEGEALEGWPQAVLVEEAKGALLAVVGRRGQGALASLFLGSVSRHVVDHAPCPVIVVPPLVR